MRGWGRGFRFSYCAHGGGYWVFNPLLLFQPIPKKHGFSLNGHSLLFYLPALLCLNGWYLRFKADFGGVEGLGLVAPKKERLPVKIACVALERI